MATARSPERIEADAESRMDELDRQLMSGLLSQAAYDAACRKLDRWTQRQYARWDAHRTMRDWRAPEWPSVGGAVMTQRERQLFETIRAGGNIQPLACRILQSLVRGGYVATEPTAYGFARCTILRRFA